LIWGGKRFFDPGNPAGRRTTVIIGHCYDWIVGMRNSEVLGRAKSAPIMVDIDQGDWARVAAFYHLLRPVILTLIDNDDFCWQNISCKESFQATR
jgi:hypothetical protein